LFTEWTKKLAEARLVIAGWDMVLTGLENAEFLDKAETGFCSKWYKPPASLPIPIVFQLVRFWIKQNLDKKMTQHCKVWISLLIDIKLKEKKGIQSTLVKTKESEILMVPMWVTEACCPLGNLTVLETTEVICVNNDVEQIIWSVAPVSIIQGALTEFIRGVGWVRDKFLRYALIDSLESPPSI